MSLPGFAYGAVYNLFSCPRQPQRLNQPLNSGHLSGSLSPDQATGDPPGSFCKQSVDTLKDFVLYNNSICVK